MADMLLMGVLGAGVLLALALALIWVVGRLFPNERRTEEDIVRATLQRRYALGEISQAEYLQALHTLDYDERLLV
jgi:uncharacterized membrane protein